jgi:hypothetical protein
LVVSGDAVFSGASGDVTTTSCTQGAMKYVGELSSNNCIAYLYICVETDVWAKTALTLHGTTSTCT